MIIEVDLFKPCSECLLNNKAALINVVKGKLTEKGTVRDVDVVRLYVFDVSEEYALLCFRKEEDDEGFYRGRMCVPKCFVDTAEKTCCLFVYHKDVLIDSVSKKPNIRRPLLLETFNVTALVEVENLDD